MIEADRYALADTLVKAGFLQEWDSDNPAAIRVALQEAVRIWTVYE
jgi:hypothetical protein